MESVRYSFENKSSNKSSGVPLESEIFNESFQWKAQPDKNFQYYWKVEPLLKLSVGLLESDLESGASTKSFQFSTGIQISTWIN